MESGWGETAWSAAVSYTHLDVYKRQGKRKSLGMTQKQLAEKLGMSDKSVSKWERGVSHS